MGIIFGKVMRNTRWLKIPYTIRHTILKSANLRFVPGKAILLKETVHNF
jgi:hypothetical protein